MRKSLLLAASLAFTVLGVPFGNAQTAPPLVAPTLAPAVSDVAGVPVVAVRAGAHPDFDRVVFDWPRTVKYQLWHEGERASLTFDAVADMKFSQDVQTHLTRARGFTAHKDDSGQITVSFVLNTAATVKVFISGTSVVLDITGKAAPETVPSPASSVQTPVPILPPQPQSGAIPSVNTATTAPTPLVSSASPPLIQAPTPSGEIPKITPPALTVSPPLVSAKPAPASVSAPNVKKPAEPIPMLTGDATLVAALDPHIQTRTVIFQRAGVGYIIFERKLTLSPEALSNGKPTLIALQPMDMPRNSGYRFAVPVDATLHATLDGTMWKIFLSKKQTELPISTLLVAQPDFALGARFLLPLPDAPEPIHFMDPLIGDDLILVPLQQSEAFNIERQLSDFDILPAAQGLVLKPLNEKLIVRTVSDGVEITAESGLTLSRAIDTGASQQSPSKARAAAAGKSIFDFSAWRGKPGETFSATRQRLQQTIVDVPDAERNRARLELARFYFANGNGEESAALLEFLVVQVPDLRLHEDYLSLLGAAEILAYHPEDGLRELDRPALSTQPEIELWIAAAQAQQRNWKEAEEKFSVLGDTLLAGYPDPFFSRFFVMAIESALAVGKNSEAADWLNFVSSAPHLEEINPALDYLRGALRAKAGNAQEAKENWSNAEKSKDRLYKVRAELALIDLGVSTDSLTSAQAADRLEALRFAWRGDDLEVDILHRLGQFYISARNIKAGLASMTQAITLYPTSPMVPQIHTEMEKIFRDTFMGDLGKKLTPFDYLTIYQQYRDLIPTGKEGDTVIRNLSERLISIDLLDQADGLLEDLVKNRLQGVDKDRTALRLAGIRLLDHKPNESLAALDLIGADVLSADMQNDRLLLHVRALSELHRDAEADALLKDNTSQGAKMLRADTAMRAKNWDEAAKTLMELIGVPPAKDTVLSVDQAGWLLNAAIAYAVSGDQAGLDRLAIDYGAFMTATPQKDTFRMLTQSDRTGQMKDLAAAQAQITQIDMFQGFLNSYRNVPPAPPKP